MKDGKHIDVIVQLREYFYRTRWMLDIVGVVTFMTHGSVLFSQRFGIDTDFIMNGRHNFDQIGRQGLVWLGKLLGLGWFNLYYAQILTLLFMALAPVAFGFLFFLTNGQNDRLNVSLFVLSVSFVVSPFWTAQVYFLNQSPQILFACILIPVSLILVELARQKPMRRWPCILLAVGLMNIIFACYQVLIMVYITGAAVMFLLCFLKEENRAGSQLRWIGFHAGCFLAGFLSYLVLTRLFFLSGSTYLESQIAWGQVSVTEGLQACAAAILNTLRNNPPYYSGIYGIYSLLFLAVTVYWLIGRGSLRKRSSVLILLAGLFLIISPYVFIVLYGGELQDRMQLVMPLSQGSMLYLTVMLFPDMKEQKNTLLRAVTGVVGLVLALLLYKDTVFRLSYCTRFYYTDEWIFRYDEQVAQKVYVDLQEVMASHEIEGSFDNYLFLGYPGIAYNAATVRGDVIGYSSFQFDIEYLNRERIVYLMRNLGYPVNSDFGREEQDDFFAYFEEYFGHEVDEMPAYPEPGYIQYLSNDEIGLEYMVIKLGDAWRTNIF